MSTANAKQVAGHFDPEQGILHLWFPEPVRLRDSAAVTQFFDEVVEDWISNTQGSVYLLVNFKNLHIVAQVADAYAANIARFQDRLLGTFRYGMPGDFTGVAVSLGNLKLQTPVNLFGDELEARAAIAEAKRSNTGKKKLQPVRPEPEADLHSRK